MNRECSIPLFQETTLVSLSSLTWIAEAASLVQDAFVAVTTEYNLQISIETISDFHASSDAGVAWVRFDQPLAFIRIAHPMSGYFSKEAIYAQPGFNRWRVPPASIAIHLCIGSVYAWSSFNTPLTRLLGVVVPAADDWSLPSVVAVFTVAIVLLGLSAAVAGSWLERVGPRTVGLVATGLWSGGFVLGGIGILTHQLWLLYLGYGVFGGCGLGLGYVSPVSTLIRWFPDRRGMATGLAIMGFGGGAIVGELLKQQLEQAFYRPPRYLGTPESVTFTSDTHRRFAVVDTSRHEVVIVGEKDIPRMFREGPAGVYVVGTGSTGMAETFFSLAAIYFLVMLTAALSYRIPPPGWSPPGWIPATTQQTSGKMMTTHDVSIAGAMRTPQFWLLWIVLCFNVTAGIGVLGVAKTMMTDLFGTALPQIVTNKFASMYVVMISVFNLSGRFFWASASDWIGRKQTYSIFLILGTLLYASIPWTAQQLNIHPSITWLVLFYAMTMLIFTMYGGGFATIPAYLADLFGTRYVGGIHGRLLTAWSTAGILGPMALALLRERALQNALRDLSTKVDPLAFQREFGASLSELPRLVESKSVTLTRLLELCPAGTPDPSSGLYNSTMYLMATLLAVAAIANSQIRPVAAVHHLKD